MRKENFNKHKLWSIFCYVSPFYYRKKFCRQKKSVWPRKDALQTLAWQSRSCDSVR